MTLSETDFHAVLGVDKDADQAAIKKAYRKLTRQYHPDGFTNASQEEQEEASRKFREVREAYEFLTGKRKNRPSADDSASDDVMQRHFKAPTTDDAVRKYDTEVTVDDLDDLLTGGPSRKDTRPARETSARRRPQRPSRQVEEPEEEEETLSGTFEEASERLQDAAEDLNRASQNARDHDEDGDYVRIAVEDLENLRDSLTALAESIDEMIPRRRGRRPGFARRR